MDMSRVLILCQRKTGKINIEYSDYSENVSKQINPAIEELASNIIGESCRFEYMSPGLVGLDGTADYRFPLDKDNKEAEAFITNHEKAYKAVVFQTCPIMFFKDTLFLVYSLLEDNGLLIIIAVNKETKNTVTINQIDVTKKGPAFQKFVTELNNYFEPTGQPFIFKKARRSHISPLN